jgi:predicted Zn finger-like uncharacterized protein
MELPRGHAIHLIVNTIGRRYTRAMLLTTCPNCSAQFKVLTDQLNIRQGRVMCGRCRQVFDAFQSLTRGPDTTGPHVPLAKSEPAPHSTTSSTLPAGDTAPPDEDASAIVLEDLESSEPVPSSAGFSKVAPIVPTGDGTANPLLSGVEGVADKKPGKGSAGWVVLSFAAGLAAIAHATYVFRADIANQWPQTRPWLAQACEPLGCDLPYGRDESAMKIETSDLLEQPGRANRIQVTATLANRGRIGMDYPWLELRLTDNANQTVLSKSLRPQDYLGAAPPPNAHVPPGAEVFINFVAEIAPKVPASGYSVRAYYP